LKDVVWYKSTYQLASNYLYKLYKSELFEGINVENQAIEELIAQINQDFQTIKNEKKRAYKKQKQSQEYVDFLDAQQSFLDSMRLIVSSMYAAHLVTTNRTKAKEKIKSIEQESTSKPLPYRVHYNLACYHSRSGDYEQALTDLENAFEQESSLQQTSLVKWAKDDPSLKQGCFILEISEVNWQSNLPTT
jgi:hypothetical protein